MPLSENQSCPSCSGLSINGLFCLTCQRSSELSACIAALNYTTGVRSAIHLIKFKFVTAGIDVFTPFFILAWNTHSFARDVSCIIPIPLHPRRFRERGFNQAELFARYIARAMKIPCEINVLARTRHTRAQNALDKNARKKNIDGAFQCARGECISGQDVLLIDDVYTTCATLQDAARALKQAGARSVFALTLAHGS